MSALSDYIHLHRENYLEHGTYSNRDDRSNYGANNFIRFREEIINRSGRYLNDEKRLRKLEIEFNNDRQKKIEALKILAKNPADYSKFIEAVLKAADLKKFNPEEVAKFLTINEKTGTLQLDQKIKELEEDMVSINIPVINSDWSSVDTLLSHIKDRGRKILSALKDQGVKNLLNKRYDFLEDQLIKCQENAIKEKNIIQKFYSLNENEISGLLGTGNVFLLTSGKAAISSPMNKAINKEIIAIAKTASLSSVMSNILGATEEILGAMGAPLLANIKNEALDGFVNNIKFLLSGQNASQGQSTSTMGFKLEDINFNKYELSQPKYQKYVTKLANGALTLNLNYDTKDKADFTISIDGNAIGVSSKAIDLSKSGYTNKSGEFVPAQIHLQRGTNLLAYLLKAQEVQDNIGTHFLNVYATNDTSLIHLADEALTIFLVYTALTGDILKDKNNAGLLYVYNTSSKLPDGSPRVHFVSVGSIINDLFSHFHFQTSDWNPDSMIYLTPNLKSISQSLQEANEEVDASSWDLDDDKRIGAAISARLTKVLGEARATILSVGLTNSYVKSVIGK